LDSYDYASLPQYLIDPFLAGQYTVHTVRFNHMLDEVVKSSEHSVGLAQCRLVECASITIDNSEPARARIVAERGSKGIIMRVHATRGAVLSNACFSTVFYAISYATPSSIKYTEPDGRILIGRRRFEEDIRIDVHDTGLACHPSTRHRFSTPFPPYAFDVWRQFISKRGLAGSIHSVDGNNRTCCWAQS
jgi:hypothetical protein